MVGILVLVVFLIAVLTGVPAMWRLGFALGLSGTLAPLLGMMAGSIVIETIMRKRYGNVGSTILAALLFCGMMYWVWATGWRLVISGQEVPGTVEVALAGGVGLLHGWTESARRLREGIPD